MRKFASEFIGTAILLMAIVGSGIMAQNLAKDVGIQLLINTFSIIFALYILITLLAPISGAHLNPVVTLYRRFENNISNQDLLSYIFAQITGGVLGVILANVMFGRKAIELSTTNRNGIGLFLGEVIATLGLLAVITMKSEQASTLVPAWIGSALLFTSSTSFANPAVTLSRSLSDTFTGIAPASILQFLLAQFLAIPILVLGKKFLREGK